MNRTVIFPGTFCPPTYGHVEIVKRAAEVFPEFTILCSVNPDKNGHWFTPDECVELWAAYDLPAGVRVTTLDRFMAEDYHGEKLLMVRGVRDDKDFEYEKSVMKLNNEQYGVKDYFFILSDEAFSNVSSSRARALAEKFDIEHLPEYVAPLVVTKLLERVLHARHLYLVVGRPGCGKSTFLRELAQYPDNHVIFTDVFNREMAILIKKHFPDESPLEANLKHEAEIQALIAGKWFDLLRQALRSTPSDKNVYVEIAYALSPRYELYRNIGGKILRVACSEAVELERLDKRGTPEHRKFLARLPSEGEIQTIVRDNRLYMVTIENNGSFDDLIAKAKTWQLGGAR
jgi:pantetheine-phosphate adenylyltransferase